MCNHTNMYWTYVEGRADDRQVADRNDRLNLKNFTA